MLDIFLLILKFCSSIKLLNDYTIYVDPQTSMYESMNKFLDSLHHAEFIYRFRCMFKLPKVMCYELNLVSPFLHLKPR